VGLWFKVCVVGGLLVTLVTLGGVGYSAMFVALMVFFGGLGASTLRSAFSYSKPDRSEAM
jgi:hypothetical protein